jgi:sugar lactone lactonase YvrE
VTFNFTATTTVDGVQAVTQGTTGLDFSVGSSNTCTGTFNAGTSCTVAVNFTPLAPGLRLGAVELLNGFGAPFMTQPVYGVGLSAEAAFYSVGSPTAINLGSYLLSSPVAVDAAGNIYFAATGVVYKSTSGGIQTIGSGFATPGALAVDGVGNVFVADTGYGKVYEIPANGGPQTTVYSSGLVRGLAVDGEGDLFVADAVQNEVVEIPANGGANTVAFGPVTTGSVVVAVAVDAAGDVFAGLNFPGSIVEVPAGCNNTSCQVLVGAGWNTPSSLAVDAAGDLYVADSGLASGNGQIIQVTPGCQQTSCQFALADGGSIYGGVESYGLALDSQGDVYYINTGYNIYGVGSGQATLNEITLSQPSVNFGVVSEGYRSADYPLMVQNIGNETLTGSMGSVFGSNFSEDSSVSTCTTFSLAPSASCVENFYVTPTTVGQVSDITFVNDNALNASGATQTVTLSALSVGPAVTFSVTGPGVGTGNVLSSITGINCNLGAGGSSSGTCSHNFNTGLTISLQENPTAGSTFTGWGGDCAAYALSQTCTVFVTVATNVTASFAAALASYTVNVTELGAGSGAVTSNPGNIECIDSSGNISGTCSDSFTGGTGVSLQASANTGATFLSWGGACASFGSSPTCSLTVNSTLSATATFIPSGSTQPGTLAPITAGVVYGQGGSFTSGTANNGGAGASSLNNPTATAVDANGNLYVADRSNSRVLFYPRGSTTATRVYGQNGSFTSTTPNNGGVSANSLGGEVFGVAVDPSGNLYIADGANYRVLFYPAGSTTATRVYGQGGSFT